MKSEIVLYSPNGFAEHIEVKFDEDTVWLTQAQMAMLFGRTKQNISLHISNVFREEELVPDLVVKEYLTTSQHGAITELFGTEVPAVSKHINNIYRTD